MIMKPWCCHGAGRLEDKAAIVRKCALQLLSKLMCFNPFGKFLPLDQLAASLDKYKLELQVRFAPHVVMSLRTKATHITACSQIGIKKVTSNINMAAFDCEEVNDSVLKTSETQHACCKRACTNKRMRPSAR